MTKADLLALAARCEAATADRQASLIEEAWWAVNRNYADDRRLRELLDAEAYLDAARTLVPAGMVWALWRCDANCPDSAAIGPTPPSGQLMEERFTAEAATPALALTAACLRMLAEEIDDV